ncbi:MAG: hypothetical protein GY756_15540, partial [bacterium]|nr:hypothetical protein [bacterium]
MIRSLIVTGFILVLSTAMICACSDDSDDSSDSTPSGSFSVTSSSITDGILPDDLKCARDG